MSNAVSSIVVLEGVELIPVLELLPSTFATQDRSSPSSGREGLEEWYRYWSDSLADSGLTGLVPIWPGSCHVPTTEFDNPEILRRLLDVIFAGWGGIEALFDPEGWQILNGGLVLRCPSVLIEPSCCANLGDAANWRKAAAYRSAEWEMLWIGHPWLSVKYEAPRLIVSDRHETDDPTARWTVCPDELQRAVVAAEVELERFARLIDPTLILLDYEGDSQVMSRKLIGLDY